MKLTRIQRRLSFLLLSMIAVAITYSCFAFARTPSPHHHADVNEPVVQDPSVVNAGGQVKPPIPDQLLPAWVKRKIFYNGSAQDGKQVALTFDDGPDDIATPKILDILKANHIKATFFIVGYQAKAHPDMVRRIVKEGHIIGNHSWSHPNFNKLSVQDAIKQISDTQNQLESITGIRPLLFRPPYGALTPDKQDAIHDMKLDIVDWSVDTKDWAGTSAATILKLVQKELYPGGIILQHCSGGKNHLSNTIAALKLLIPELHNQGYTFVTVPKLLHLPDSQPK